MEMLVENKIVQVRINGVGNAFLRELGCNCVQCNANIKRASTSASLIIREKGKASSKILKHALFDCGPGTVDSLIDCAISTIDCLFNSHNHFDHIGDIDRIINSLSRHKPQFTTLPVYATEGTWKRGIDSNFHWLENNIEWNNLIINEEIQPVVPFPNINLKITPVPVYHGPYAFQPVIFVIEFETNGQNKKIILCWDILHLETKLADYTKDTKQNPNQEQIGDLSSIFKTLMQADDLFLAGNTITPNPNTGHQSIIDGLDLISKIHPKKTWILHYSGHEDKFGPISDEELQSWININKVNYGLGDAEIKLAKHGMVINYSI